jgi:hypothetical protein
MWKEKNPRARNNVGKKYQPMHIPEDGILYSHRLDNFKFYIALTGWDL